MYGNTMAMKKTGRLMTRDTRNRVCEVGRCDTQIKINKQNCEKLSLRGWAMCWC